MFCANCGSKMNDTDKFCGKCGAKREVVNPVAETVIPGPEAVSCEPKVMPTEPQIMRPAFETPGAYYGQPAPDQAEPKAKQGLSPAKVGIIAAVAAVLVGIICIAVFALFGGSGGVMGAVEKSAAAYSQIGSELDLPDLTELAKGQEYSQSLSVWLESFDEMPEIEGFGVRLDADCSIPDRNMDMILTPFYGSVDILDVVLKLDDAQMYIGSPELTEETYYSVDTETLGQKLAEKEVGEELAGISFNVFELADKMTDYYASNEDALKGLGKAYGEFKDALQISRKGKQTVDVNGYDTKCTAYEVVISEEALNILIDALEDYLYAVGDVENMIAIFEDMGYPAEMIAEMEESLGDEDVYGEAIDELRYAIEGMEDVALNVYVSGGYVAAVAWEGQIEGEAVSVTVNLGGGRNYVDDLSIRIESEGAEVVLTSSGNHTGKGGLLTDETTLTMDGEVLMTSIFNYDVNSDGELCWQLEIGTISVTVEGSLLTDQTGFDLHIDELNVYENGESMGLGIGLAYSLGEYEGSTIDVSESVRVFDLSEDELDAQMESITMNAYSLIFDLADEIPALSNILSEAMG